MPSMAGMLSSIGPTEVFDFVGAALDRQPQCRGRVTHAKRHRVDRRPVLRRENRPPGPTAPC